MIDSRHRVAPDPLDERFAVASEVIADAAALALGYFRHLESLTITDKGPRDMVSQADLETETLIRTRLMERFPDDGFLGEETGRIDSSAGGGIWVVDPIDGTLPFISGMTSWCVSIAYVLDGRVEMGLVSSPARDESFAGRRGGAATLNGRPISVSSASRLDQGMVAVGYSPRVGADDILPMLERLLRAGGTFYRDGSGALALCYVACGRLIGYVEAHINSWDCLGALAVVEAAGGSSNEFLAGDGLWIGGRLVAGPPTLFAALAAVLDPTVPR